MLNLVQQKYSIGFILTPGFPDD